MKKSKGFRSGARRLLTKEPRERGKIRLSKLLQEYQPGTSVVVMIAQASKKECLTDATTAKSAQ